MLPPLSLFDIRHSYSAISVPSPHDSVPHALGVPEGWGARAVLFYPRYSPVFVSRSVAPPGLGYLERPLTTGFRPWLEDFRPSGAWELWCDAFHGLSPLRGLRFFTDRLPQAYAYRYAPIPMRVTYRATWLARQTPAKGVPVRGNRRPRDYVRHGHFHLARDDGHVPYESVRVMLLDVGGRCERRSAWFLRTQGRSKGKRREDTTVWRDHRPGLVGAISRSG